MVPGSHWFQAALSCDLTASNTVSTLIVEMPLTGSSDLNIVNKCSGIYGPQSAGSFMEKNATILVPNADAICIGPESGLSMTSALAMSAL